MIRPQVPMKPGRKHAFTHSIENVVCAKVSVAAHPPRARRLRLVHNELLSRLRSKRQPLRPVSARSGRKEFIATGKWKSITSGGRSPSRGHGGGLKRQCPDSTGRSSARHLHEATCAAQSGGSR